MAKEYSTKNINKNYLPNKRVQIVSQRHDTKDLNEITYLTMCNCPDTANCKQRI
jgi:hypothetical protein